MEYRNEQVEKQMILIKSLLTAISEKQSGKLKVNEIIKEDPLMSFDKAVQIGMQRSANKSMVATKALATGLDRIIVMVDQMVNEMVESEMPCGKRYKKRLEVLTNFKRIMDELNPTMANRFAHV